MLGHVSKGIEGATCGGVGGGGVDKGLPGHVNLVLEEDVVKSCLQVLLVLNVSLVVGSIDLHDHPHQSRKAALSMKWGKGGRQGWGEPQR